MPEYTAFPDAEALVSEALRDASLAVGVRVYSSIPKQPTFPLITVKRIGGIPIERHQVDLASIQVDVWGTSKSEAHDIAQAARVAIHQMEDSATTDGYVAGVEDASGLTWLPDPPTARDRYIFGVRLTTHAV